MPFFIWYCKS